MISTLITNLAFYSMFILYINTYIYVYVYFCIYISVSISISKEREIFDDFKIFCMCIRFIECNTPIYLWYFLRAYKKILATFL